MVEVGNGLDVVTRARLRLRAMSGIGWVLTPRGIKTRSPATTRDQSGDGVPSGLIAGFAFTVDFIVMPAVAALFILMIARTRGLRRDNVFFGAGVAIVLAAWMAHNQSCFGHPLRVGFHFHTDPTYGALYRKGFMGIHPPDFEALLGLSISPARGLFFLSPVLLLAFPGWLRLARDPVTRSDAIATSSISLAILLFAATTIEWKGGWSMGARYLVPTIPFLLVGVAGFLRDRPVGGYAVFSFVALSGVGVAAVALSAAGFSSFPYPFSNPIYHFALPLLRHGFHTDGLFFPYVMQRFAVVLYAALTIGAAGCIAWSAFVGHDRRIRASVAACGAAIVVMVVLGEIPESADNEREREVSAAQVIHMMGY